MRTSVRITATVMAITALSSCAACGGPQTREQTASSATETHASDTTSVATPGDETTAGATTAGQTAPTGNEPLIEWSVAARFGSESFVVRPDLTATYSASSGDPTQPPVERQLTVSRAELDRVAAFLRAHDFCSIVSQRQMGVPDEGRATLTVRLPGVVCSVTLWDNEWSDNGPAQACAQVMHALHERGRAGR